MVSLSVHFPTSQMQEERNSLSTQVTSSRYLPPVPPCETSWKTAAHYRQHFCTHLQELQLHLEIQSFQSFRTVNDRHGKPFSRRVLHNSHFPLYTGHTLQEVSKAIFPLKIVVFFRTLPAKHLTKLHQSLLFVQGKWFSVNTHKHLTVPKVLLRKGITSTRGNHAHSAKQQNATARSLRGRQPWSQQGWAKCHSWKGNALAVPEAIAPLTLCMFCLYISSPTSSHHHTLLEVFIWGLQIRSLLHGQIIFPGVCQPSLAHQGHQPAGPCPPLLSHTPAPIPLCLCFIYLLSFSASPEHPVCLFFHWCFYIAETNKFSSVLMSTPQRRLSPADQFDPEVTAHGAINWLTAVNCP